MEHPYKYKYSWLGGTVLLGRAADDNIWFYGGFGMKKTINIWKNLILDIWENWIGFKNGSR